MKNPLLDEDSVFCGMNGDDFRPLIPAQIKNKDNTYVYAKVDGSIEVLVGRPKSHDESRFNDVWGGTILFQGTRGDGKKVLGYTICQHDLDKPMVHHPDERFYPGQSHPGLGHWVSMSMVRNVERFARELKCGHDDLAAVVYPFTYFHEYEIFLHELGYHLGDEGFYHQNIGVGEKIKHVERELEERGLRDSRNWRRNLRAQTWYALNNDCMFDLESMPFMEKDL